MIMRTKKEINERVAAQKRAYENYLSAIEREWEYEAMELGEMIFEIIGNEMTLSKSWLETISAKNERLLVEVNRRIEEATPEGFEIMISYSRKILKINNVLNPEYERLISMAYAVKRNQKLIELGVNDEL